MKAEFKLILKPFLIILYPSYSNKRACIFNGLHQFLQMLGIHNFEGNHSFKRTCIGSNANCLHIDLQLLRNNICNGANVFLRKISWVRIFA